MPLLSLDPVPLLESTDSGLLRFRDNVQLNYDKIQNIINKLDAANIKDGSLTRVKASSEPFTAFVPALDQGGTAVSFTTTYCSYTKIGRVVTYVGKLDVTGAGVGNQEVHVTLPFAPVAPFLGAGIMCGTGFIWDSSAGFIFPGLCRIFNPTQFAYLSTFSSSPTFLGANQFTAALAVNDEINWTLIYESTS